MGKKQLRKFEVAEPPPIRHDLRVKAPSFVRGHNHGTYHTGMGEVVQPQRDGSCHKHISSRGIG